MAIVGSKNYKKHLVQDHTLRSDSILNYTIETTGEYKKLIGECRHSSMRLFAYFTSSSEDAKQAIRTEYMMRTRNIQGS